jgi:hypothetical protein
MFKSSSITIAAAFVVTAFLGIGCQKDTSVPAGNASGPVTHEGTRDAVSFVSSGFGPQAPGFRLEGDCYTLTGGGVVNFCTGGAGTFCAGGFQFTLGVNGINGGWGPYYYIKPQNQTGTYGRCKVRFKYNYANAHVGDYNTMTKTWSFGASNSVTFDATQVFWHPPACY